MPFPDKHSIQDRLFIREKTKGLYLNRVERKVNEWTGNGMEKSEMTNK